MVSSIAPHCAAAMQYEETLMATKPKTATSAPAAAKTAKKTKATKSAKKR